VDVCSLVKRHTYCSIALESLVSELLSLYSEKLRASRRGASVLLKVVSIESEKHAEIIDLLAKELDLYVEYEDCRSLVGEPWRAVEDLLATLKSGVEIEPKEFLKRLAWVERAVGEETYHRVLLPLITGRDVVEQCVSPLTVLDGICEYL